MVTADETAVRERACILKGRAQILEELAALLPPKLEGSAMPMSDQALIELAVLRSQHVYRIAAWANEAANALANSLAELRSEWMGEAAGKA